MIVILISIYYRRKGKPNTDIKESEIMIAEMRPVRLGQVRAEKRITKSELARRAKMAPTTVKWIEEGRFIPYSSQIEKIARALGVDDPASLLEQIEG